MTGFESGFNVSLLGIPWRTWRLGGEKTYAFRILLRVLPNVGTLNDVALLGVAFAIPDSLIFRVF